MDKRSELAANVILGFFTLFIAGIIQTQITGDCYPGIPCNLYAWLIVPVVFYISHRITLWIPRQISEYRKWKKEHDPKAIKLSYRKSGDLILLKIHNHEWREPSMTVGRVSNRSANEAENHLIASSTFVIPKDRRKELVLFRLNPLQERFHLLAVHSGGSQYEGSHFNAGIHYFEIILLYRFGENTTSHVKKFVATVIYDGLDKIRMYFREKDLSTEQSTSEHN
jgi:hypothetical protein